MGGKRGSGWCVWNITVNLHLKEMKNDEVYEELSE
jgi:hypothetical protein